MRFPFEYYLRYLLYLGKSNGAIQQALQDKLLIRNVSDADLDLRRGRLNSVLVVLMEKGLSEAEILQDLGIFEFVDHFVHKNFIASVHASFGILQYNSLRRMVEASIILRKELKLVAEAASDLLGRSVNEEVIRIYSHYFCSSEMDLGEWYVFLKKNDVYGLISLIDCRDFGHLVADRIAGAVSQSREYKIVHERAFDLLFASMSEDAPDPDTCLKWFKLFDSAKSKMPPLMEDVKAGEGGRLSMGLGGPVDYPIRRVEDFVTVQETEEPGPPGARPEEV